MLAFGGRRSLSIFLNDHERDLLFTNLLKTVNLFIDEFPRHFGAGAGL
jgi:hypothetical protein